MRQGLGRVRQDSWHGPESALRKPRLPGPASLPPTLQLHRTLGNQGVQRLLATHALQAKLRVSQPDDPYELEADRIAEHVMRMPVPEERGKAPCAACAGGGSPCPECAAKSARPLWRKETVPSAPLTGQLAPDDLLQGLGPGRPLDVDTRAFFEPRFGHDFGQVRVHADARAAESARMVNALAYTVGSNVVFGAGSYVPQSSAGQRLMAHELAHVIQQGSAATPPGQAAKTTSTRIQSGPIGLSRHAVDTTSANHRVDRKAPVGTTDLGTAADVPPVASVSVGLAGIVFTPPRDARLHAGPRNPQILAIVLRTLLGDLYTDAFRDQVIAAWGNTPMFSQDPAKGPGAYSPQEIRGPDANEGDVVPSPITWEPIGFRSLLAICAKLGKPVTLTPERQRLLDLGAVASQAYGQITDLPKWFTRPIFVAVMANRARMLEDLAKAVKADALPPDVDPMLGAQAQLAVREIRDSLGVSVTVVDAIRTDSTLVRHPGYQKLWKPLKLRGSEGDDAVAPETRVPALLPAAVLITYADARPELALEALNLTDARKRLLDGFVQALKYREGVGEGEGVQQLAESPTQAYTAPPYPSTLSVYPPLEAGLYGSTRADYGFQMALQFPDIAAAFQWHDYDFEMFRVPDDKLVNAAAAMTGPGTAPSHWAMLNKRLAQDERYREADVKAYGDSLWNQLGPPGVTILSPINLVAGMRVLGTLISTLFETLSDPSYVARFNFEDEGLYIVRCIASWNVSGDVALRRPPSVAYVPLFARDPGILAEERLQQQLAEETQATDRLAEVKQLLDGVLDDKRRQELEEEKKRLEAATGGVEAILTYQQDILKPSTDEGASDRAEKLEQILGTRAARGFGKDSMRLPAVYVNDAGQIIDLLLEVRTISEDATTGTGEYEVNDATTPSSTSSGTFSGKRHDAIVAALKKLFKDSDYGRGRASVRVDGVLESIDVPTVSAGKLFIEAASDVATILSVIAIVAAPFTGGSSIMLMVPAMVIGAVPSAYNIIHRGIDHTFHFDLALAMDIVNVVGALVGVGAETRVGMQAIRLGTTTGRVIIVTGIGAMAGGVVLMSAGVARQIEALKDIPEGLRGAELMEVLGQFMLNAGIMVGGILASQARARGEFEPRTFEDWITQIDEGTRNKLEATKGETEPGRNLWKIYAEMDPFVRELLTQCGSDCVPMNPPPSAADQARIKKLDVGLSPRAQRTLKGLLHDNRMPAAMDKVLTGIEAARAKAVKSKKSTKAAVEKAVLARGSAADYILANFTEEPVEALDVQNPGKWQRVRALAEEVAAKKTIALETIGDVLDRVRRTPGEDPEEILSLLKQLSEIADKVQGVDKLLGPNGLTGHFNFYKGARWTLRFLREADLWDSVKAFEEPAPGVLIDRTIDVRLTDGTRIELKSWAAWKDIAQEGFSRQIMADFLGTNGFRDPVVWAFEPGAGIGTESEVIAKMSAALDKALAEGWRGYDDAMAAARVAAIKAALPRIVQVGAK